LPRPKSWDEFEDICADVLKRLWNDPYIVRNGRSGQKQNGVDIYGHPGHLGRSTLGKYAGAQCKDTYELRITTVEEQVEKAKGFNPPLSEYLLMTTAARDATLQEEVRTKSWPFRVHVMFWDDISLELSGHDDLLQKHFPGWMRKTTTKEQVLNMLLSSEPEDFNYDDSTGVFVHTRDIKLRIVLERNTESEKEFDEPWVHRFPDPTGTRQPVYIDYGGTRVQEVPCVYVDGGRHILPIPKSVTDLTISRFQYHIGRILNLPIPGYGFDFALQQAGISVQK
jgi:hypothetical protein